MWDVQILSKSGWGRRNTRNKKTNKPHMYLLCLSFVICFVLFPFCRQIMGQNNISIYLLHLPPLPRAAWLHRKLHLNMLQFRWLLSGDNIDSVCGVSVGLVMIWIVRRKGVQGNRIRKLAFLCCMHCCYSRCHWIVCTIVNEILTLNLSVLIWITFSVCACTSSH